MTNKHNIYCSGEDKYGQLALANEKISEKGVYCIDAKWDQTSIV